MAPTMTLEEEAPSKSRENSMRHGLSGAGVVLPENLRIQVDRRRQAYAKLFPPVNQLDVDDIDSAALGWARFIECRSERTHRAVHRAGLARGHWATIRTMDAQERAKRLAYDPPNVVARLKTSLGGVQWLLEQWNMLRHVLDSSPTGEWSPKQQERAQNLAGVDRLFRQDDLHKIRSGDAGDRRKLVEAQVAELHGLLADGELERLDEAARLETIIGEHALHDPAHEKMGLYEQRARRMYERSIQRLADRHLERHPELAGPKRRRSVDRARIAELEAKADSLIAEEGEAVAIDPESPALDGLSGVEIDPEENRWDGPESAPDRAAIVERWSDPAIQALVSDAELKMVGSKTRDSVREMIAGWGLGGQIDVDTALRGIMGRRRSRAQRTGVPDAELDAIARAASRHEREQADRQRRQDDRDRQRRKQKDARKARKRNRPR